MSVRRQCTHKARMGKQSKQGKGQCSGNAKEKETMTLLRPQRVREHTVLWQQSNIIGPKQKKLLASPEPRSSCTKMLRGFLINVRFYADGLMSSRGQAGSPLQLNWLLFSQAHFLRVKGHNLDLFPRGAFFFFNWSCIPREISQSPTVLHFYFVSPLWGKWQ